MVLVLVPVQMHFGSLYAVRAGTTGTGTVVPAPFGTSSNKNFPVLVPNLVGNLNI